MRTRTRASSEATIDEGGETNWAAAAAAAAVEPAAPAMNDDLLTHMHEEEEEWVNTGVENENEEEDEEPVIRHENTANRRSQSWILKVAIPDSAPNTNGNGDNWESVNICIDSGMTAERLGRCIIQAVPSTCLDYSQEYNYNDDGRTNHRTGSILVGLFGKEDRVFYSLECILAMDPAEGARRIFCVKEPVRWEVATQNEAGDRGWLSIFSYSNIRNLPVAIVVLFVAIFIAPIIVDHFDDLYHFMYSLLTLVPQDVPSLWRIISFVFDWPVREVYRYGPSLVGWEGRDLVDICTQMNRRYYFVGLGRDSDGHNNYEDREYWWHHPETCETIYRMQEESFVRMCRPLWYLTVIVVSFMAIRRFLTAFFAKEPDPQVNRIDRAVLDTYRALLMLSREHRRQEDRRQQQQRMKER